MNNKEIAKAYVAAFNAGDFKTLAKYLAADFQFSGPIPQPVGRDQFLSLMENMLRAFPDIKFNTQLVSIDGNVVRFTNQLAGTHTGDLDLSAMGMGVIPATGKSFSMARENGESVIEDGYVVSTHVAPTKGAGMIAILHQIGVEVRGA
jgi:predicted ester cyclase